MQFFKMIGLSEFIGFQKKESLIPRQVLSHYWSDRKTILEKDVNLFCWKRKPIEEIDGYLSHILEKKPQPLRLSVNLDELGKQLKKASELWGDAGSSEGGSFWEEIQMLVGDFLRLANAKTGTLYIKIVTDNACSKFHTDGYTLRLFSTYLGKGTEWIPEAATNRKGLGKSNELIVKDPSKIEQMKAFEVGILKGETPNNPHLVKGIVHKSPGILNTNEKRVILRVDV